jgi:hypothetical protein
LTEKLAKWRLSYVIKLSAAQVNVLAHLSEWAITNETSARLIASTFGDVLPARRQP